MITMMMQEQLHHVLHLSLGKCHGVTLKGLHCALMSTMCQAAGCWLLSLEKTDETPVFSSANSLLSSAYHYVVVFFPPK